MEDSAARPTRTRKPSSLLVESMESESPVPKRRLSSAADDAVVASPSSAQPPAKSPRMATPAAAAAAAAAAATSALDLKGAMKKVYEEIVGAKDRAGRLRAEVFHKLPTKRELPEYYTFIKSPMDLKTIQGHMGREGHYQTLDAFMADINLMFDNAMTFNDPTSEIYSDAKVLKALADKTVKALGPIPAPAAAAAAAPTPAKASKSAPETPKLSIKLGPGDTPGSLKRKAGGEDSGAPIMMDRKRLTAMFMDIYDTIVKVEVYDAEDDSVRVASEIFMRVPSRKDYPDYYKIIAKPIDLKTIHERIHNGVYNTFEEMQVDYDLLFDNAQTYNEEGSVVYEDAALLRKTLRDAVDLARSIARMGDGDYFKGKKEHDKAVADKEEREKEREKEKEDKPASKSKKTSSGSKGGAGADAEDASTVTIAATPSPAIKKIKIKPMPAAGGEESPEAKTPSLKIRIPKRGADTAAPATPATPAALKVKINLPQISQAQHEALAKVTIRPPPAKRAFLASYNPAQTAFQKVLDDVRYAYDADGRQFAELFVQLPTREELPEYHAVITSPIDIHDIQKRIKEDKYKSAQAFLDDMTLMFDNATTFNEPGSEVHSDAILLKAIMAHSMKKHITDNAAASAAATPSGAGSSSSTAAATPAVKKAKTPGSAKGTPKDHAKDDAESEDGAADGEKKEHGPPKSFFLDEGGERIEFYVGRDLGRYMGLARGDLYRNYPLLFRRRATEEERRHLIDTGVVVDNQATLFVVKKVQGDLILEGKGQIFKDISRYRKQKAAEQKGDGAAAALSSMTTMAGSAVSAAAAAAMIDASGQPALMSIAAPSPVPHDTLAPIVNAAETEAMLKTCEALLDIVQNHVDDEKRNVAEPFVTLPTREDLPEYYQTITNPQDLESIRARLKAGKYAAAHEFVRDMGLVFTNAGIFNDEKSQIVEDAELLMKLFCERARAQLPRQAILACPLLRTGAPLVKDVTLDLLRRMDRAVDPKTKRHVAAAFNVLPDENELPEYYTAIKSPVAMCTLKERIFDGYYHTLGEFQEDVFTMCRNARSFNEPDTEIHEDAVALQRLFIRELRAVTDEQGITTSATVYTEAQVDEELEVEKRVAIASDTTGGEEAKRKYQPEMESDEDHITYRVGDFVLLANPAPGKPPHVANVRNLWKGPDGRQYCQVLYYYRPEETFHLATRSFFVNEVLRSNDLFVHPLSQVIRKCYVAYLRDYQRSVPVGIPDEDYFVCESRYASRGRAMSKIKQWQPHESVVELTPREKTLDPRTLPRKKSIFAESASAAASNVGGDPRNVVLSKPPGTDESGVNPKFVYFETMYVDSQRYRLGDFVYIKTRHAAEEPLIARIERLWKDDKDTAFLHGSLYIRPEETSHEASREFFERELLRSSMSETHAMANVIGRCHVMITEEYQRTRPIDVSEDDVYLCESRYSVKQRQITKIKTLGDIKLSAAVTQDMVVFKTAKELKRMPSPILDKLRAEEEARRRRDEALLRFEENERRGEQQRVALAGAATSAAAAAAGAGKKAGGSGYIPDVQSLIAAQQHQPMSKEVIRKQHNPTPYMVFTIAQKALARNSGVRVDGDYEVQLQHEWRTLTPDRRAQYEKLAKDCTEQIAANESALGQQHRLNQLGGIISMVMVPTTSIFQCCWGSCRAQFATRDEFNCHMMRNHIVNGDSFVCAWNRSACTSVHESRNHLAQHFIHYHADSARKSVDSVVLPGSSRRTRRQDILQEAMLTLCNPPDDPPVVTMTYQTLPMQGAQPMQGVQAMQGMQGPGSHTHAPATQQPVPQAPVAEAEAPPVFFSSAYLEYLKKDVSRAVPDEGDDVEPMAVSSPYEHLRSFHSCLVELTRQLHDA